MTRKEFESIVEEAMRELPPVLRDRIDNVEVIVQDSPNRRQSGRHGGLYGLYEGVSLDRRGHDYQGALPDRITIFKRPIERDFPDRDEMVKCIRETVFHEVGHYFGFDDKDLERMGIG